MSENNINSRKIKSIDNDVFIIPRYDKGFQLVKNIKENIIFFYEVLLPASVEEKVQSLLKQGKIKDAEKFIKSASKEKQSWTFLTMLANSKEYSYIDIIKIIAKNTDKVEYIIDSPEKRNAFWSINTLVSLEALKISLCKS